MLQLPFASVLALFGKPPLLQVYKAKIKRKEREKSTFACGGVDPGRVGCERGRYGLADCAAASAAAAGVGALAAAGRDGVQNRLRLPGELSQQLQRIEIGARPAKHRCIFEIVSSRLQMGFPFPPLSFPKNGCLRSVCPPLKKISRVSLSRVACKTASLVTCAAESIGQFRCLALSPSCSCWVACEIYLVLPRCPGESQCDGCACLMRFSKSHAREEHKATCRILI